MYGFKVVQHSDMSTTITQYDKVKSIPKFIPRSVPDTDCSGNEPTRPEEITGYKSMLGKLLFIG